MRISAKTDYAIRAVVEMAAAGGDERRLVKAEAVADAQQIPLRFLLGIMNELRRAGLVDSRRGSDGGYRLAKPGYAITIADIIRAVDGPLANVAGVRPESLALTGSAAPLGDVWISLRSSIRSVLENVTVADVVSGKLPESVVELTRDADAWLPR